MTQAEKTRLLAERVMGCEVVDSGISGLWVAFKDGNVVSGAKTWSPLTNLANAGEVLEAMVRKGFEFEAQDCGVGKYKSWFRAPGVGAQAYAPLLSTAICHAALLAEGVKEEEL